MDLLFVLIFIMVPIICSIILRASGFSLIRVGLPQFVITALFFFAYLGTLPLYFYWDDYRFESGVHDKLIIFSMMLASGYTMFGVAIGAAFSKIAFGKSVTPNLNGDTRHIRKIFIINSFLFLIVLLVFYRYLELIPRLAILEVLFQSASDSKLARSSMGNDFEGSYHWYKLFIEELANFVAFVFYSLYLKTKKRFSLILFILSFIVSAFACVMATEKGPFVWLLIGLFVVWTLVGANGRYPLRGLFLIFISVLIFLVFAYIYFMGVDDIGKALLNIISRAFAGSIQPAYHYIEFFPDRKDFLLGASLPNPGGIFPHVPYQLSREIMNWVNPEGYLRGVVGTMPTVFWGEAYANFGVVGIIFFPVFIGFLVQLVELLFSKFKNTPLKIGFYVWVVIHYKNLSGTGFSGFIFDFYFIAIFIIFFACSVMADGLKFKLKN